LARLHNYFAYSGQEAYVNIQLFGHVDTVGEVETNLELSAQRAAAAPESPGYGYGHRSDACFDSWRKGAGWRHIITCGCVLTVPLSVVIQDQRATQ